MIIKSIVHQDAGGEFRLFCSDMSKYGYVPVGPVEVEYEVPADFNPTAAQVAALEKKLGALADDYHRSAAVIRDRISKLQCIENSPAGEA